jgi:hypothetical protein
VASAGCDKLHVGGSNGMNRKNTDRAFRVENVVFVDFRPPTMECSQDQQLRQLQAFLDAFIITAGKERATRPHVSLQLQDALGRILDTAGLSLIPHTVSEKS